jgi:para-nitrobenzyl esterase
VGRRTLRLASGGQPAWLMLRRFYDAAPDISKNVPMLICNISEEGKSDVFPAERGGVHTTLARALITAMNKAHPEKRVRTLSNGVNGLTARNNAERIVNLKYEQKAAPVYQYYYYFIWANLPMLGGGGRMAYSGKRRRSPGRCSGSIPESSPMGNRGAPAAGS